MAVLIDHVRTRVDVWLDPFADPLGAGYQVVQALHAFARGGLLGVGLGGGLPEIAGRPPIPQVHTDFPLAALGEELGVLGVVAILGLYLVVVERGLQDRCRGGRRLPFAAGGRPRAGHRHPGVHHRRRRPQGPAADRGDPAVHQLRRIVAAGERARHRAAAGALGQGRRTATRCRGSARAGAGSPAGETA